MFYSNIGTLYESPSEEDLKKIYITNKEVLGLLTEALPVNQYGIPTRSITEAEKLAAKEYIAKNFPKIYSVIYPDDPKLVEYRTYLNACYTNFRSVCKKIETLSGIIPFKGGFDEMEVYQTNAVSKTQDGIGLAVEWMAADKACTYAAAKLNIGQPDWWHECWTINN